MAILKVFATLTEGVSIKQTSSVTIEPVTNRVFFIKISSLKSVNTPSACRLGSKIIIGVSQQCPRLLLGKRIGQRHSFNHRIR